MARRVLVLEDEPTLRRTVARYLGRSGLEAVEAETCAGAEEALRSGPIDVILTDVNLPDGDGFRVVEMAASLPVAPPVLVMTGDPSVDCAINAIRHGARDFLVKPFSYEALDRALERALGPAPAELVGPPTIDPAEWRARYAPAMIGDHARLLEVFAVVERIADTDCSVLVTGESGTGKELVARAIHRAGARTNRPFVALNCAAIPEGLLESELFGHTKGSFTGATANRVGRFALADGGTLFLDEIGEMSAALQAKLLRVLQEKEVTPVGAQGAVKVDARVIAATHRDLDALVEEGRFREDLLYRLNVIPIELPSLRDRVDDLPQLVDHFVARFNGRRRRQVVGFTAPALAAMKRYAWPGNVRELENLVERLVILRGEGLIDLPDLPRKVRTERRTDVEAPELPTDGLDLKDAVDRYENALILQALERTGWNKNQAASLLKMNRTTLVEKLKKRGLDERGGSGGAVGDVADVEPSRGPLLGRSVA